LQGLDQQQLKLPDAVTVSRALQGRRPRPTRIELTTVAAGDRLGIVRHLMQVAGGGAGGTPIQQLAAMLWADGHERQSPLATEVGIIIVLETRWTVWQPRPMALATGQAEAQHPR
jgi:hypothetical protein